MASLQFRLKVGVILLCLSLAGTPVYAQVAVIEAKPAPKTSPIDFQFSYGHLANTDIKRNSGDFHRNSLGAGLQAKLSLGSEFIINNKFIYEHHNYTFSGSSRFQFDAVNRYAYIPTLQWQTSQRVTIMAVPIIQWFGETGTNVGDAFFGGGLVGFNWISSPTLSLGFLIGAISRIEDNIQVAPVPLVYWRFVENWMLRVGPHELGPTSGLGVELAWQLHKTIELSSGAQFQQRRFSIDRNDQVAQETLLPIFLKGQWQFIPEGRLEIFASIAAGGKLRLENKTGKKITEKKYENTPYVGVRLAFTF